MNNYYSLLYFFVCSVNLTTVYFNNNLNIFSLKVSLQRCVMKVKIIFWGGGRGAENFLAGKEAAGQISLRNTDLYGVIIVLTTF